MFHVIFFFKFCSTDHQHIIHCCRFRALNVLVYSNSWPGLLTLALCTHSLSTQDLSEREQILAEREALVAERDALESQRLRSSQEAALDITRLSMQIDSIESSIKLKEPSPSEQERVGRLKKERFVQCSDIRHPARGKSLKQLARGTVLPWWFSY